MLRVIYPRPLTSSRNYRLVQVTHCAKVTRSMSRRNFRLALAKVALFANAWDRSLQKESKLTDGYITCRMNESADLDPRWRSLFLQWIYIDGVRVSVSFHLSAQRRLGVFIEGMWVAIYVRNRRTSFSSIFLSTVGEGWFGETKLCHFNWPLET